MKLAHVVICTPHRCGLYETTRELVAAERALGMDARMFDPAPTPFYPKTAEDRGAVLADKSFLAEADVIVDHSGCDGSTDNLNAPHILVAHGRPRHSFLSEVNGGPPIWSYHHRLDRTEKYKAVVTFWPEHVGHLRVAFRRKPVYHVPACVDLTAWTPEGPSGYQFHGNAGAYNVVIADAWRDDCDPFDAVCATALAARRLPGLRLHIYGKSGGEKGWPVLLQILREDDSLGEVAGWIKGLENVYRAADLLVTANQIDTRAVREALACGCPVYAVEPGSAERNAEKIVRRLCGNSPLSHRPNQFSAREAAQLQFNPLNTAKAFLAVVSKECNGR